jgi:hypothetical protein
MCRKHYPLHKKPNRIYHLLEIIKEVTNVTIHSYTPGKILKIQFERSFSLKYQ